MCVCISVFFLNLCYRTYFFSWIICRFIRSPYLCNVFFIVLDLRLTKVGVQRHSFFMFVRQLWGEKLPGLCYRFLLIVSFLPPFYYLCPHLKEKRMIVCIAEKPLWRDIADVLGAREKKDGYIEGNGYQVTWTFGHLCTLKSL